MVITVDVFVSAASCSGAGWMCYLVLFLYYMLYILRRDLQKHVLPESFHVKFGVVAELCWNFAFWQKGTLYGGLNTKSMGCFVD